MSLGTVKFRESQLNDFGTSSSCVRKPRNNSEVQYGSNNVKKFTKKEKKAGSDYAEAVKVPPNDCLACSGCVTQEKTEVLQNRSVDDFLLNVNSGKAVIVSISPQTMASFAAHYCLSPFQVLKKLTTFFKSFGAKAVFDTSCGRDLALEEACYEFVERYKQSESRGRKKCFPMISSACPGWIEHAEKNLGSKELPYVSSVKSPQQMMGTIVKRYLCHKMSLRPDEVYHVTVMPCYEKKSEAVRDDFFFQIEYEDGDDINGKMRVAEVDCVLTSSEVLKLLQSQSVDFATLDESPADSLLTHVSDDGRLCGVHGTSGGYAETIFKHAAKSLFGKNIEGPLDFKKLEADFYEVCLEVEGKIQLKFALYYGPRNLATATQKIKSGKCKYHFLEIMTCPSGCLLGGGQIELKSGQSPEDSSHRVKEAYKENVLMADPLRNPKVRWLYEEWVGDSGSEKAKQYMHTGYHPVGRHPLHW